MILLRRSVASFERSVMYRERAAGMYSELPFALAQCASLTSPRTAATWHVSFAAGMHGLVALFAMMSGSDDVLLLPGASSRFRTTSRRRLCSPASATSSWALTTRQVRGWRPSACYARSAAMKPLCLHPKLQALTKSVVPIAAKFFLYCLTIFLTLNLMVRSKAKCTLARRTPAT